MNLNIGFFINIAIYLVMIAFSVSTFLLVFRFLKNTMHSGEKMISSLDKRYKQKGEMGKEKKKLSKYGIMYRFGNYNLIPAKYETFRIFIGIVVVFVLMLFDIGLLSILGFPVGYFGIDFILKRMNNSDNEAMAMDIYNTYANLKIQLSSGVFLGDCLEYTYKIVQNKRYKEALGEFVLNFADKTLTSVEAIEIFRNRFQSKEIDKLCSMMEMFVQYGISENYIQDIMTEIQSILTADSMRAEHLVEQKTGFVTFGFFLLVIALTVVAMLQTMQGVQLF